MKKTILETFLESYLNSWNQIAIHQEKKKKKEK